MELNKILPNYRLWLYNLVTNDNWVDIPAGDYYQLIQYLVETDYYWSVPLDEDRATNGIALRKRWAKEFEVPIEDVEFIFQHRPCSVLEMLLAMCLDAEERIMWDFDIGNQSSRWFWLIMSNLGIACMDDNHFDYEFVAKAVDIMLNREYDADGSNGGPFVVPNPKKDLRTVNYWMQFMWYLASLQHYD